MASEENDLCVCFHVPRGKIIKFIRQNQPKYASQVSECYSAGTGCGWCIPFIKEMHEAILKGEDVPGESMSLDEYLAQRRAYHQKKNLKKGEDFPDDSSGDEASINPPEVQSLTDDFDLKDSFDTEFKDRLGSDLP